MTPAERARIEELLQDPSLSFRAIARATGYSDHTIRRVSRQVTNDPRPMRQRLSRSNDDAGSTITGWLVLGGLVLGVYPTLALAMKYWMTARL